MPKSPDPAAQPGPRAFTVNIQAVARCPRLSILPSHWREDGTCACRCAACGLLLGVCACVPVDEPIVGRRW